MEINDVPHGEVHHHFYRSAVVGDDRDYYVYTPPGYAKSTKRFPVLYLLHGFSDDASGWTAVGHANIILDNLIAAGKAKPMIVVMPLGYGAPAVVSRGPRDPAANKANVPKFREMLITELMPRVEAEYRIERARDQHAIAGLSMGGAESLFTGLNNLDKFAYVASFSAGGLGEDYATLFPKLDQSANKDLKLALDRLRNRRPPDRNKPQIPRHAVRKVCKVHAHRNARNAHLDGMAKKSGSIDAAIVSVGRDQPVTEPRLSRRGPPLRRCSTEQPVLRMNIQSSNFLETSTPVVAHQFTALDPALGSDRTLRPVPYFHAQQRSVVGRRAYLRVDLVPKAVQHYAPENVQPR